jgi:hypothetical protein
MRRVVRVGVCLFSLSHEPGKLFLMRFVVPEGVRTRVFAFADMGNLEKGLDYRTKCSLSIG